MSDSIPPPPPSFDVRAIIALTIIAAFLWAYGQNPHDDTLKGALIMAFAAAWGFYLGSSRGSQAKDDLLAGIARTGATSTGPAESAP